MKKETKRQIFHLMIGIPFIAILLYYGREFALAAVLVFYIAGSIAINLRLMRMKTVVVEWMEEQFERRNVLFPGWGGATYLVGILMPLAFLANVNQIAASIFILAVGDSLSTLVGRMGKAKLPYNKKKTLEGSLAFLLSSLLAYYFVGPVIVPLALIAAAVESLPFDVDDNLTIPVVCVIFFLVL
jgi:phosphoserine phosphatase